MVNKLSLLAADTPRTASFDLATVVDRLAKLASTGTGMIPYTGRRRRSVKPPRSLLNSTLLRMRAMRPSGRTVGRAAAGLAGGYGISHLIDRATSGPAYDSDGYPLQPHAYVSPNISMGSDVIRKYIGDKNAPLGYKNPMEHGKLWRTMNHTGYLTTADKQTPAYNDYKHLYDYANNPSPLNARGKLLAAHVNGMP